MCIKAQEELVWCNAGYVMEGVIPGTFLSHSVTKVLCLYWGFPRAPALSTPLVYLLLTTVIHKEIYVYVYIYIDIIWQSTAFQEKGTESRNTYY